MNLALSIAADPTDAELVVLARDSDRAAFSELHDRTARMVHAVLLSRVSATDADDLVQDVFLTALSRLQSLNDPAKFGPWLLQIARNRATDVHRRPRLVELPEEMPSRARPSVEAAQVLGHIRALPEAYRETLLDAPRRGHDRTRDRREDGPDARLGAREPPPRDEAPA